MPAQGRSYGYASEGTASSSLHWATLGMMAGGAVGGLTRGTFAVRRVLTIRGAARGPHTVPWRKNPDGARTVEEAVEIAKSHGILIPDDIHFYVDDLDMLPKDTYARYFRDRDVMPDTLVYWEEFYNPN